MAKEKKTEKEKKPADLNEKELNEEIDKILEKNFKDYKSQEDLDSFIEKTFNEKTEKYNKELKNKEKLLNKKIKENENYFIFFRINKNEENEKNDNKKMNNKIKEMDKKLENRVKAILRGNI